MNGFEKKFLPVLFLAFAFTIAFTVSCKPHAETQSSLNLNTAKAVMGNGQDGKESLAQVMQNFDSGIDGLIATLGNLTDALPPNPSQIGKTDAYENELLLTFFYASLLDRDEWKKIILSKDFDRVGNNLNTIRISFNKTTTTSSTETDSYTEIASAASQGLGLNDSTEQIVIPSVFAVGAIAYLLTFGISGLDLLKGSLKTTVTTPGRDTVTAQLQKLKDALQTAKDELLATKTELDSVQKTLWEKSSIELQSTHMIAQSARKGLIDNTERIHKIEANLLKDGLTEEKKIQLQKTLNILKKSVAAEEKRLLLFPTKNLAAQQQLDIEIINLTKKKASLQIRSKFQNDKLRSLKNQIPIKENELRGAPAEDQTTIIDRRRFTSFERARTFFGARKNSQIMEISGLPKGGDLHKMHQWLGLLGFLATTAVFAAVVADKDGSQSSQIGLEYAAGTLSLFLSILTFVVGYNIHKTLNALQAAEKTKYAKASPAIPEPTESESGGSESGSERGNSDSSQDLEAEDAKSSSTIEKLTTCLSCMKTHSKLVLYSGAATTHLILGITTIADAIITTKKEVNLTDSTPIADPTHPLPNSFIMSLAAHYIILMNLRSQLISHGVQLGEMIPADYLQ